MQLKFTNVQNYTKKYIKCLENVIDFFDVIVSGESNKIESGLVKAISNDRELEFLDNNEFLIFADTPEKTKKDEIKENKLF